MRSKDLVLLLEQVQNSNTYLVLDSIQALQDYTQYTDDEIDIVLPALLQATLHDDRTIAAKAIKAMLFLAPSHEETLEALFGLAQSSFVSLRWKAAVAFGQGDFTDIRVLELLCQLMQDKNGNVRRSAVHSLVHLQEHTTRAVDGLLGATMHADVRVAKIAREALKDTQYIDVDTLDNLFASGIPEYKKFAVIYTREQAVKNDSHLSRETIVRLLKSALLNDFQNIKHIVLHSIQWLIAQGYCWHEFKDAVVHCILHDVEALHTQAIYLLTSYNLSLWDSMLILERVFLRKNQQSILMTMKELVLPAESDIEAKELLSEQIGPLFSLEHVDIRSLALDAIEKHCSDVPSILDVVRTRSVWKDENSTYEHDVALRKRLIQAGFEYAPLSIQIEFVRDILKFNGTDDVIQAMQLAQGLSKSGRSLISDVQPFLYREPNVAQSASKALVAFGASSTWYLFEAANDPLHASAALFGHQGLLELGSAAIPTLLEEAIAPQQPYSAVDALRYISLQNEISLADVLKIKELAHHSTVWIRRSFFEIVALCSESLPPELQQLVNQALEDEIWDVRTSALCALQQHPDDSDVLLSKLLSLTSDEQEDIRSAALLALASCCSSKVDSIDCTVFTEALSDPAWQVRAAAASALGLFGTQALAHVESLQERLLDAYVFVREEAQWAIEEITQTSMCAA